MAYTDADAYRGAATKTTAPQRARAAQWDGVAPAPTCRADRGGRLAGGAIRSPIGEQCGDDDSTTAHSRQTSSQPCRRRSGDTRREPSDHLDSSSLAAPELRSGKKGDDGRHEEERHARVLRGEVPATSNLSSVSRNELDAEVAAWPRSRRRPPRRRRRRTRPRAAGARGGRPGRPVTAARTRGARRRPSSTRCRRRHRDAPRGRSRARRGRPPSASRARTERGRCS